MNRQIKFFELKQKGLSYSSIGKIFGISRQRVHQIISGYVSHSKRINIKKNGYKYDKIEYIFNIIFSRDNYKCQKCGKKAILIHHIDGNWKNNVYNNLISLCNKCHLNLHRPVISGKKNYFWKDGRTKNPNYKKNCWKIYYEKNKEKLKERRNERKKLCVIDKIS